MPSPEYPFEPSIVFALNNKTGGISDGNQLELPQNSPLTDTSSTTNQSLEGLKPHASARLGFLPNRFSTDLEITQLLPSRQSEEIAENKTAAKIREELKQTGNISPIIGRTPDAQSKSEQPEPKFTLEGRELLQVENLSQDANWTLNFLYNLGYTMYLSDRAEMRGINLEAGLAELRNRGLLDESNPEQPKLIKAQLDKNVQSKLEEMPFIEREEHEGGALTWGERLTKNAFWVLDYLHIGYSKYIREVAEMDGIDLDAGLAELRRQGLLDESNPEYPEVKLPQPKLTSL